MTTLQPLVVQIARLLLARQEIIATAESCTGGRLASYLTAQTGASNWYASGAITYSEKQKVELLGVDPSLIARHGVVSREVALAMARGAQKRFGANNGICRASRGHSCVAHWHCLDWNSPREPTLCTQTTNTKRARGSHRGGLP